MFDWDRFKNGEIAVHCDTEEKAKHFLKECDKQGIMWSIDRANHHTNYDVYYETTCYRTIGGKLTYCDIEHFKRKGIEIIKWEVKEMEKTFREVIADIKEGQVWENSLLKIRFLRNGYIDIENTMGWENGTGISIMADLKFTLQRKKYTFEEAFKAYEEGKEIESVHSGYRYKRENGKDLYFSKITERWAENEEFKTKEIMNMWYINETM